MSSGRVVLRRPDLVDAIEALGYGKVAGDDTYGMRSAERVQDVDPNGGGAPVAESTLVRHHLGEAGNVDQLHDQPDRAPLLDHIEHGD